jgi:hypothetical protein
MAKNRQDLPPEVVASREIYNVAQEPLKQKIAEMEERQALIAQCHEVIGRVQANALMAKFANVSNLVYLKNIKESKIYRNLPMVGTWENYCEYLGLSRQKVDEDLANLAAFGEDFLTTCQQLQVGYRDLRKLRQLTHSGAIQVTDDALEISGECIPLDADHKEDIQAAIEKIIEEQAGLKEELTAQKKANDRAQEANRKEIVKLQKDLDRLEARAQGKGLSAEEDAFLEKVEAHKILVQGSFLALDPAEIKQIVPEMTYTMRATIIATVHFLKMQALALYDAVTTQIGDPVINPEIIEEYEQWLKDYRAGEQPDEA